MFIRIEFNCDNDTFADDLDSEVKAILKQCQEAITVRDDSRNLRDSNGNTVGQYRAGNGVYQNA